MATAIEVAGRWLRLIFRHGDRPPVKQRDVLAMLAVGDLGDEDKKRDEDKHPDLRVASIATLAALCEVGESTVKRAVAWARRYGLLALRGGGARRGHRLGNGTVIPTTWRLVIA
jgi:hypothetical protein